MYLGVNFLVPLRVQKSFGKYLKEIIPELFLLLIRLLL